MDRDLMNEEIARLRQSNFRSLSFVRPLEERFEQDTRKERAHRLWLEGLIAIIAFNACLLIDYMSVKNDPLLELVVKRMVLVTPVALLVNFLMRQDPKQWLREGSVGFGTVVICFINLYVEGNGTPGTTTFGLLAVLITALFVNVVMRIRFPYAVVSTATMLAGGWWFTYHAAGLMVTERTIGASMLLIGVGITLTAGYSLERQERLEYLLFQRSEMQAEELHRLSNLDKLTGLPNRRALEERFEKLWAEGMRAGTPLSAIVIDIDHFKVVNDVYGHLYGDEVLRRVAGLLPQALRVQEDIAARFGGEEFVILLPDTPPDRAMVVAERVRSLVEMAGTPTPELGTEKGKMMWATVSCGVSTCVPEGGLTRERLLKTADRALYRAKGLGRNRVEFKVCERTSSSNVIVEPASSLSSGARLMISKLGVRRESGSRPQAQVK